VARDLNSLRKIAYLKVKGPPNNEAWTFNSLVILAKTVLGLEFKRLEKDPIWDSYTEEEILIEYFAFLFHKHKDLADSAAQELFGEVVTEDDFLEWAEKEMAEEVKQLLKNYCRFNPRVSDS